MPTLLRAKGLGTFKNELGLAEGLLLTADNVVIDRDDVIKPRRGVTNYGTEAPTDTYYTQILEYKNRILTYNDETLFFDSNSQDGSFSAFDGSYTPIESGIRLKYVESNGNLYFTSNDGIKKISGTLDSNGNTNFTSNSGFIIDAGGPKALDLVGNIVYQDGGFLPPLSKVVYRVVWGYRDNNNNLIIGSPGSRFTISNTDTTAFANVFLSTPIPTDATTTEYFYQIYRTDVATTTPEGVADLSLPDELRLVFEKNLTDTDLAGTEVSLTDEAPELFRDSGTILYTNDVSGDGILQANEKPPIAKDVALFRSSVFYANTSTIQRRQFRLLSVANFTSEDSRFIVGNDNTTREYTFVGETEEYTITTTAAAALDGTYILMNSASNEKKYFFWFDTTGSTTEPIDTDTEGRIPVKVLLGVGDDADTVAQKLADEITNVADIDFNVSHTAPSSIITITNTKNGNTDNATNGITSPGFVFGVITEGDGEEADTTNGGDVLLSSLISPSQSIDETARSLVNIINRDTNSLVNAFYLSGEDDLPGIILFESKNLSDNEFYIAVEDDTADITEQFSPTLNNTVFISSSVGVDSNTKTQYTTSTPHGYSVGTNVFIYENIENPPASGDYDITTALGTYTITAAAASTFTVEKAFTVTSTGRVFKAEHVSDNEVKPNRVYYSKAGIPEAVPLVNFLDIGGQDSEIERIIALRDSLFVLKTEGVYTITGDAGNFSVRLLDNSTFILAPDSAAVLNNQIYMLSSQGVASISDTGIGVVSRPIEDRILGVTNDGFSFRTSAFGVGYESDRSYILWVPTIEDDLIATQAYRFNTFNRSWVRWTVPARSGVVNPIDDRLYITDNETGYVKQERKSKDRTDFADQDHIASILPGEVEDDNPVLQLSSLDNVSAGDAIVQPQYVTASRMNRLLNKLDLDYGIQIYINSISVNNPAIVTTSKVHNLNTYDYVTMTTDDLVEGQPSIPGTTFQVTVTGTNTFTIDLDGSTLPPGLGGKVDKYYDNFKIEPTTDIVQNFADLVEMLDLDYDIPPATASAVSTGSDTITAVGHGYITGQRVEVTNTGTAIETLPLGLLDTGEAVYIQVVDSDTFRVSETLDDALNDIYIDLVTLGTDDHIFTAKFSTPTLDPSLEELRQDYNTLISELNYSSQNQFHNYTEIREDELVSYETLITEVNLQTNQVTLAFMPPYISGEVVIYKGISCTVDWAPQHFGEPSVSKQVSEGTIVFDGNNFYNATVEYSTDLSKDFEGRMFFGQGTGFWGGFTVSEAAWGGEGTDVPYRTIIPRQKQRCRYMTVRFKHINAREDFTVLGMSLEPRLLSQRAYRSII